MTSYPGQGVPSYSGQPPPQAGYPPQGGAPGYPPQGGAPGYPPQGGAPGYPSQGGAPGYPPQGGAPGYPPQGAPGYPSQGGAPGYPSQGAPGYPPQGGAPGYPPQGGAPGYPPQGGAPAGAVPAYKGEVPSQDVRDDPNMAAPQASAPSLDMMDHLPGYDNIGFDGVSLPPPSYEESQREAPQRDNIESVPTISEEEARDALIQFVSEHCCYGKGPAEEMKFNDLNSSSAFHYTLETFGEGRSTKWAREPYKGQPVVVNGPPPGPWDIQAPPPAMFKTTKLDIEVPNTASVKPCHACFASGFQRCYRCHGRGRLFCTSCNGTGREHYYEQGERLHRQCVWCNGFGRKTCYTCSGSGQITCSECKGRANLRWFILLTIKWTNHVEDHIVERTALPDELIRGVSGQMAFEETQPRVWPINHFPEQEINSASNNLVHQHSSKFPSERMLMQRHRVRIVPVTQVFYKYKDDQDSFFVYGFEHKVHAPDYPAQCCCGCSIL
ncbi:protein SSUH2 homolog [Aplysia californica]|uniref:Protein SSUH2 homolog n=1 Tax=Aplysia californica TaxID=6500 RepID=A0ABM0JAM4_APLCA|nr:protein SSUH2 homolog [Aplysia californica]